MLRCLVTSFFLLNTFKYRVYSRISPELYTSQTCIHRKYVFNGYLYVLRPSKPFDRKLKSLILVNFLNLFFQFDWYASIYGSLAILISCVSKTWASPKWAIVIWYWAWAIKIKAWSTPKNLKNEPKLTSFDTYTNIQT